MFPCQSKWRDCGLLRRQVHCLLNNGTKYFYFCFKWQCKYLNSFFSRSSSTSCSSVFLYIFFLKFNFSHDFEQVRFEFQRKNDCKHNSFETFFFSSFPQDLTNVGFGCHFKIFTITYSHHCLIGINTLKSLKWIGWTHC